MPKIPKHKCLKIFFKAFNSIHTRKMEQILLAYSFHEETVTDLMVLYKNTKIIFGSPDGNTDFFF